MSDTPAVNDDDDDATIILANLVAWGPPHVPNCKSEPCEACGELIWLAPSSLAVLNSDPEARKRCLPCGLESMHEVSGVAMIPGQLEELKQATGEDVTEKVQQIISQLDKSVKESKRDTDGD